MTTAKESNCTRPFCKHPVKDHTAVKAAGFGFYITREACTRCDCIRPPD